MKTTVKFPISVLFESYASIECVINRVKRRRGGAPKVRDREPRKINRVEGLGGLGAGINRLSGCLAVCLSICHVIFLRPDKVFLSP
jgi:hypothetical protein